jgi:hypothetical protein
MVCNANQIFLGRSDDEMGEIVASVRQKYIHTYIHGSGEET